jgi:hypothetical protein
MLNLPSSDKQLRIAKTGDTYPRSLLVEAAQHLLGPFGKDSELRRYGLELAKRGGRAVSPESLELVARRMASGLLWAEAGIRKIRHAQDLPRLAVAPALSTPSSTPANAVAPSCVASSSAGQLKPYHSSTK